ncbi:MAG: thioredoxin family protein [Planctomycetota bacterium]|nr:MAG: thioredoxin family protein [Planctomycetota bacterium]
MSESPIPTENTPSEAKQSRWGIWLIFLVLAGAYLVVSRPKPVKSVTPWVHDFDAGLAKARKNKQLVLIEFFATWCKPCLSMDKHVFSLQKVADSLANWVPIKIDVEKQPQLEQRYNVQALPTFVILSPDGREIRRREETMSSKMFIEFVKSTEKEHSDKGTRPPVIP